MRETLFRGKRSDIDRFVYGDLFHDYDVFGHITASYIYEFDLMHGRSFQMEVDPETVGQFTGLLDKNGRKSYEGDIIKSHYANVAKPYLVETIVFHGGKFASEYSLSGSGKSWVPLADGIKHVSFDTSIYMTEFEIIGNIHENPELLEETK